MAFNHVRVSLAVVVSYMLIVYVSCDEGPDKRIPVSEPSSVQQQMTHLQGELQTLQATVQAQTGEISFLKQQLSQANNAYISCDDEPDKRILLSDPNYVEQQMTHLQGELQTLQATVQTQTGDISSLKQQLSEAKNAVGGSTFVRWGRTDCPSNLTELVYSGYAGGSWYNDKGAAADYLCLPSDPEWLQTSVVPDDATGRVYGAEYESDPGHTLFGSHSHNEEVPCAVCRSTSFGSSVMIPARTTCYNGWTKAYSGSLASGYYGAEAASQYVCVDEHAQPLAGGADRNDNGKLFHGVKAFCGSLRCPPYEQDKYIACVVCMK